MRFFFLGFDSGSGNDSSAAASPGTAEKRKKVATQSYKRQAGADEAGSTPTSAPDSREESLERLSPPQCSYTQPEQQSPLARRQSRLKLPTADPFEQPQVQQNRRIPQFGGPHTIPLPNMLSEQQEVQPNGQSEISDFDRLYQPLSDDLLSEFLNIDNAFPDIPPDTYEELPQLEDPDQFSNQ